MPAIQPVQSAAQIEAKKQLEKFEAERKAAEENKRQHEIEA